MATAELDTSDMNTLVERIRRGDRNARNDLIIQLQHRLERLARRMLRGFPGVGRWVEAEDVLQNAMLRLLKSLQSFDLKNTTELFSWATELIRRELIDLARHFLGPEGHGANHESGTIDPYGPDDLPNPREPLASDPSGDDLARWQAFHEKVVDLPAKEREIFGLIYYDGLTQAQVGELFGCSEKTARTYYHRACAMLKERLNGDWANPE